MIVDLVRVLYTIALECLILESRKSHFLPPLVWNHAFFFFGGEGVYKNATTPPLIRRGFDINNLSTYVVKGSPYGPTI